MQTNHSAVPVKCTQGNATLFAGPYGALVLTGKRTRKDSLYWSLLEHGQRVSLQGLYRGRYCDAIAASVDLFAALLAVGCAKDAADLERALVANGINPRS